MRKLRILRLVNAIRETSAPYHQFTLPQLDKYEVTLCTYFDPEIPIDPRVTVFSGEGTAFGFIKALLLAFKHQRDDIIHIHTAQVGVLFLLATLIYRPSNLSRSIFTIHSSYQNYKLRNRLLLVPIFMLMHRIISCSHASYKSFPSRFQWLARKRYGVIQNGVDLARIDKQIAGTARKTSEKLRIVTVGRLIELKRPFVLLKAFADFSDGNQQLTYIGDGDLKGPLQSHSRERNISRDVIFTGVIPRDTVFASLNNSDLFVSTSRIEGLPVAVLEAMSCSCPVILSDIPQHREIATDAPFIPLFPLNDTDSLCKELENFRALSQLERDNIGEQCRQWVEQRFSLQKMHREYDSTYESMINVANLVVQSLS